MSRSVGRISAGLYLAVSLAVSYIVFGSPIAIEDPGLLDLPLYVILGLHYLWGAVLLLSSTEYRRFGRGSYRRLLLVPEILASASLLFFLFTFIFALNANMDYVQRFIRSGGNLRLALDTTTERILVWVRVFPLVAVDLGAYLLYRAGRYRLVVGAMNERGRPRETIVRPWAFLLTLVSAFLVAIAMPSFVDLDGFPMLGWIAYVPLFLVLRSARFGHGVFYGISFGVFTTLLSSYWLGTFSLVSLQITVLFFLIYYSVFTPLALHVSRVARFARVLVFPLAWTLFEFLRSSGFLGYPWALTAHSQYSVLPVIQMVEWTGVWGLSFLVLLANSAIAEFLGALFGRLSVRHSERSGHGWRLHPAGATVRRSFGWLAGITGLVGMIVLVGGIMLVVDPDADSSRTARVAQIQQNNDPRKAEYERTFSTLSRLTNEAMASDPDLVVWSETAFVPNIRRWAEDTSSRRFHRLVTEFLEYQDQLDTWLLTGNDDYEVVRNAEGAEVDRLNFNAAVLFSDDARRVDTYHKIQLVPFTEYFPYREQLPWVYELLLEFDVYFWEPGEAPVIFEHPLFAFSTPICYEDVFPNYVRGLVNAGAEVILNISNDYWSLAEVQAKQHFVAGLFRAVENRRPVLRTTSSGLTSHIDTMGRILQTAPYFEEAFLVSDLVIPEELRTTLYSRFGDYFPLLAGLALLVIWATSLPAAIRERRELPSLPPPAPAPDQSAARRPSRPAAVKESATTPRSSGNRPEPAGRPSPARSPAPSGPERAPEDGKAAKRRRKRSRGDRMNWREIWDD